MLEQREMEAELWRTIYTKEFGLYCVGDGGRDRLTNLKQGNDIIK